MHIPDGFVSGSINIASGAIAAAAVGVSVWQAGRQVRKEPRTMPLLATSAAFVFAAQMLNFPIGGGTSGHFLGAATVAALLGGWSSCLVLAVVLLIQCLGFADGGLSALGTNVVNMGVVGGLGSYLVMRALRPMLPRGRGGFVLAVAGASWLSVVLASTACALELAVSGTSPLRVVAPAMVGTHMIIGVGEALIAMAVLAVVAATRPDILPAWAGASTPKDAAVARRGVWALPLAGLALALMLAAFIRPFASSAPDGLEKVAKSKGFLEQAEGKDVWKKSPVPDYALPGGKSEGIATGLGGVLGTVLVFGLGLGVIKLVGARRNNRKQDPGSPRPSEETTDEHR
jgi:cobalt/nickel transport system permease protein